jgi:PAS domain S-box-containing protein
MHFGMTRREDATSAGPEGAPPITGFPRNSASSARHADFRAIAEAIPHVVWIASTEGAVEYLNSRGCAYTGFPSNATYALDWTDLMHPEDAARARLAWGEGSRTRSSFELECRIRRADGAFRCHSVGTSPMLDVDGRIMSWIGTATDIDDRKRTEDRLRRAERESDEFRSVVMANMAEGVYTLDGEGRFTFLNAAAERMLGWSEEELRGRAVHATIHFQHPDGSPLPDEERELLLARTERRAVHVADDAFTHRDGSIFPVAYSATPLLGAADPGGLVVVFRDTTEERTQREHGKRRLDALTWVGRARDALDEGRLTLYSQPIVPLAGGEPSEELLLRMIGREGQVIRPANFLPAAEKYGLIGEIDQRVVVQAAQVAASGRRVQANLSALSISGLDLLPLIEYAVSDSGANPSDLVFEITETALMKDGEGGETFARGVAEIGCDLALDDFGTGYGSFTRLKRLPIRYLKIDTEFVRDLPSSPANKHIIEAIISLAKGFGQQTIAEGVEDAETLALLAEAGVDFAQGYHLGRPAPLEGVAASLAGGGRGAA